MDKRKAVLNVGVSLASRVLLLVAAFAVRRLLIGRLGSGVNGLDSLYLSIMDVLGIAELGVGGAIVFSMYRPIVEGDRQRVAALFCFYRSTYRVIGAIILVAGLAVTPFLPLLIGDYASLGLDVRTPYLLTLASVYLSYLYSAKTSLIEAHKNNWLTTTILTASRLTRYAMQAAAIVALESYVAYTTGKIVETLVAWLLTEAVVRRMHGDVLATDARLDEETKDEVQRGVKALFMHKVGGMLVGSVDSLVISAFVGVAALGRYSNYALVASALAATVRLFFTPLTSVIGHLCASGDQAAAKRHFDQLHCLNYLLGTTCFLAYFVMADGLVALLLGTGQEVSRVVVFAITLNQFTGFMRSTQLLFRDASGTFFNDRWKPLVEGVANLALSLLLVQVLPEDISVAGVVASTIVTTLAIGDVIEPYVVFRHVFGQAPWRFCARSYAYTALFTADLLLLGRIAPPTDDVSGLMLNMLISLSVSATTLALVAAVDRSFRADLLSWVHALLSWVARRQKTS